MPGNESEICLQYLQDNAFENIKNVKFVIFSQNLPKTGEMNDFDKFVVG